MQVLPSPMPNVPRYGAPGLSRARRFEIIRWIKRTTEHLAYTSLRDGAIFFVPRRAWDWSEQYLQDFLQCTSPQVAYCSGVDLVRVQAFETIGRYGIMYIVSWRRKRDGKLFRAVCQLTPGS